MTEGRNFDELDPADPETIRYSCADADFALRLYHIILLISMMKQSQH